MGINPTRKAYGRANRSYLVTEPGIGDGIGCTLPKSAFNTAEGVTDGVVPAGYPIQVDSDGKAAPFEAYEPGEDGAPGTGGELAGFTIDPVNVTNGDQSIGYQWYGAIDPSRLPVDFDPADVAPGNSRFYFAAKA